MAGNSTVFIVDDDPGALKSLQWMIEQADWRVKAFGSGREFLDYYRAGETGCLVLDVRMPEMDGLALQKTLRDRKIRLPIIFITAYGDVPTCALAFRGGAVDYLEKPVNDKVLLERIEKLIAREEQRRNGNGIACFGERLGMLTLTEVEILDALIQGRSIKDIANARKVTVQTIWRHQVNIFEKIGVRSQIELVRVATQWQIQQGQPVSIADS